MKKIIFYIIGTVSIFLFSLGISVFCFASDASNTSVTTDTTDTYSLSTTLDFIGKIGNPRNKVKIDISGMSSNFVVIPYFRYYTRDTGSHWLSFFLAIYDKKEDITYIPTRSSSEHNFVQSFYDNGTIKLSESDIGSITKADGLFYGLSQQNQIFLDLKSNNELLPYYVTDKFYKEFDFPFSLTDVKNKGTWFIVGNNYPFANSIYSSDIYYPSLFALQFTMDESLEYNFDFELQGSNVVYTDLSNYYLEVFASTNNDDTVIYQSSFKLTDLYSRWIQSSKVYQVKDNFYKIFPNMNPHNDFTVFVRCRYDDGNVKLVSKYQFYVQPSSDIENPDTPKFFQGEGNLPTNLAPGSIQDSAYPQSSFDGNYNFGDFNALNFVKGGGGLPSLVNGVSTVFSFLPPWLWQMMWYVLGALAVIALLKVVIS